MSYTGKFAYITICQLSGALAKFSLLTSQKARSPTAHSTCLGTQWQDVNHIPGNTDSKNEEKTSYKN